MINPHIFRAYDIRGIADPLDHAPADLTEESVYLIGKGIGTYLIRKYATKTIAVGRDNRLTGPKLQNAFMKGLSETGLKVTNIGLAISPMVYWSVCAKREQSEMLTNSPTEHHGEVTASLPFDAAANLTASHNPKEYNGIKVVTHNAHSICGEELQEVLKIIQNNDFISASPTAPDNLEIWPKYLDDLASKVTMHRKLKVVVDAGNGTAGKFAPEFLRKIGCEVIELYCELDGNFPNHEANPEELENMHDLIKAVQTNHADLGIGFDGDGDRVGIVDEKGRHYSSDFMLLLLARDMLKRLPKAKVVFDVKFSKVIIDDLIAHGAEPVMSKTGHSFIENKMKEIGAPLAGEVSGHLFFGENYYGFDDALLAAGKIVQIVSEETHPLSQMFNTLPQTFSTPELKLHCPDDRKFAVVKDLVDHFTAAYECITIDGVRVNFDELSWGAVRASNTSPNLTLRFESGTPERLKEIQQLMLTELQKHPEVNTSKLVESIR